MWFIPLNENGETIDYFYRCGTQLEMKEALADWLRSQITFGSTAACDIDETVAEGTRRISKLAET